jgi:hypothetical protein
MKKALAATYLPAAPTPVEVLQVSWDEAARRRR